MVHVDSKYYIDDTHIKISIKPWKEGMTVEPRTLEQVSYDIVRDLASRCSNVFRNPKYYVEEAKDDS